MGRLDEWKSDLWNLAGIPTPTNDAETNETVVFGYLVAWFLGEVRGLQAVLARQYEKYEADLLKLVSLLLCNSSAPLVLLSVLSHATASVS